MEKIMNNSSLIKSECDQEADEKIWGIYSIPLSWSMEQTVVYAYQFSQPQQVL